jgi:hypothetical protein
MRNITEVNNKAAHIKLADELTAIADEIRGTNENGAYRAVIVFDSRNSVYSKPLGAQMKDYEAIGLLEYAKLSVALEGGE